MKRILLTLIFSVTAFSMQAQIWLGGNAHAILNKDIRTFSIAPDVGYCFPNTPFSIACAFEYGGTMKNEEDYTHSLTVSPYLRHDLCSLGERFSLFVDFTSEMDVLDWSFINIGLVPGVSFLLTEHWSTEFNLGFLGYKQRQIPGDPIEKNFVLSFEASAASFKFYYNF